MNGRLRLKATILGDRWQGLVLAMGTSQTVMSVRKRLARESSSRCRTNRGRCTSRRPMAMRATGESSPSKLAGLIGIATFIGMQ